MASSNPFIEDTHAEDKEDNENVGNLDSNYNEEKHDVMSMSYSEISNLQNVFSPENQIPTTSTRKSRPDTLTCDKKKGRLLFRL
jgi:hypothetical protein